MTKIIALSGKGGVGKTSLAALIVKMLVNKTDSRVLAIDGDPAVGLSTALGVEVKRTLDEIRIETINKAGSEKKAAKSILQDLEFELTEALSEKHGFAFLAIGRPEATGCYCAVNEYLKMLIGRLAPNFDYVVIDGEAGIEQINRRVMEKVTHLLLVSDASLKGLNVVESIRDVARKNMIYEKCGLIVNRAAKEELTENFLPDIPLLGILPESKELRNADIKGLPVFSYEDKKLQDTLDKIITSFLDIDDEVKNV